MNEQQSTSCSAKTETNADTLGKLPPKITKQDLENVAATTKGKTFYWFKIVFFLILSSFLVSFAAYSLITPNDFTIGGISGIGIIVNVATNGKVPQWVILFSINLPLVILSFFFVKKRFAILSAANTGMQSLWLFMLENVSPFNKLQIEFGSNGEKIFAAIAAGICIGTAIGLAFKIGGSTGGADILAVLIQKKFAATSIAWMLFIINCTIISSSIFVFKADTLALRLLPVMMAAFESYIESKTNEAVTNGFQSAIEFRIITDKPEEMSQALMHELSRGVTMLPAMGMYTKESHSMLLCVVSRRQVATLRRVMKTVDPDSFAVMSQVSQVLGLGFYSTEI
ncbi:MAG: YitT family protein [Clostridia bacterium]|nr:YitT family protein [Clostridia bacterium]